MSTLLWPTEIISSTSSSSRGARFLRHDRNFGQNLTVNGFQFAANVPLCGSSAGNMGEEESIQKSGIEKQLLRSSGAVGRHVRIQQQRRRRVVSDSVAATVDCSVDVSDALVMQQHMFVVILLWWR